MQKPFLLKLCSLLAACSLQACGWVDSTGSQSSSLPAVVDPTLTILEEGDSFAINENTQSSIVFASADSQLSGWSWDRLDGHASTQSCSSVPNFDQDSASNALINSCSSSIACQLSIDETSSGSVTSFTITTPQLRAPTALDYRVTAQASDGTTIERRHTICAIPINDAPDPMDDEYSVLRSTVLQINGDGASSLLANDSDDQDLRNEPLTVLTTPLSPPRYATSFTLFENGGFVYEPSEEAPISSDGSISDQFSYTVTDGTNSNSATVFIRVSNVNTSPVQTAALPDVQVFIIDENTEAEEDLSAFFSDAESDSLNFTALADTLPTSGNLSITGDGRLVGIAEDADSGSYFVQIGIDDSLESIAAAFFLEIVRTNGINSAPFASDINNATVSGDFTYDVSGFFGDSDGDNLTYTATGLPDDVSINPYGVISGTVTDDNEGNAFIRVFANDGHGGRNSDAFRLRLRSSS